jgi:ABC transport system ATP-binding/permease protein
LWGDDYTYHSTLYSVYSQADATRRLLLCWLALGAIILALVMVIGIFLKRKDVRA